MADPYAQLQAGLAGQYTLERELGRGGMATVFLAQETSALAARRASSNLRGA